MNILITGASGLIGTTLTNALTNRNATIYRLVRRPPQNALEITWHPDKGHLDVAALPQLDAVVHLAGENIAGGRWTATRKRRILDSRVNGTHLLSQTLANLSHPPHTLISASAMGYYGHRADEILTENSAQGRGFLPEVCQAWENAAQPAINAGIRTVFPRIGIVLTPDGGALGKMLLPFKLGLGGVIGSGTQYMSWISVDDLINIILYAIDTPTLSGPINAVSPTPITNRSFTKTLGHVLHRPTLFPLPAFAARLVLGEMADALLLSSIRVLPAKLQASKFTFTHPTLEPTLRNLLNK
jgi:uncharacterized protein (TIGR01777 family)